MLLFCFPVYAEDEAYEFQNIGNEALALQGEDVNQILNDQFVEQKNEVIRNILSEPLANSEFSVNSFTVIDNNNSELPVRLIFEITGTRPQNLFAYRTLPTLDQSGFVTIQNPGDFIQARIPFILHGIYTSQNLNNKNYFVGDYYIDTSSIGNSVTNPVYISNDFLSDVADVFSWILSHIGDLITFILANAFLSVSLLLFMCGAVISFFVRLKRS